MDLSTAMERMWIDEVLNLHALWRIGPPRDDTAFNDRLSVANTTTFKREARRRKKAGKKQQKNVNPWPSPPSSADEIRGWDEVCNEGNPSAPKPLSDEERVKVAGLQVQKDCVKFCTDFFSKQCTLDNENDGYNDDEENDRNESGEEISFKFFMGIFENDTDLRAYYDKHSEKGEFVCLVCVGFGEKLGRKYKDCVSLVQHSNSIMKTKSKLAHRSFSRVVCRILGWNSLKLPSGVLYVADQQEYGQKGGFPDLKTDHEDDLVLDSWKC